MAVFHRYGEELVDKEQLERTRARLRYSFAMRMDSTASIANAVASFVALRNTPETINKLFALYQQITPEDIRAAVNKFFTESNSTVVTLQYKSLVDQAGGQR